MKKVLLGVGGVLGVAVVGLVAVIAMQPADFSLERTRVIAATPSDVWPHVSDLRGFIAWSPWQDLDPDQTVSFSDPSTGVGAWYAWEGNDDVGKGRMSFTELEPEVRVVEKLEFIEPFASVADVTITIEPVEGGSKVSWGFATQNDFMGKAFSLVVDMDAMLGADFEKGLERLAVVAERDAVARKEREAAAAKELAEAEALAADQAVTDAPAAP